MEIEELKRKLFNTDINDRNELLKCFIEIYYYNEELVQEGFYQLLFNRLKDVYKPITEDDKTIQLLRKMKNGEVESNQDNLSLVIIEQLMIGIKGNIGIDKAVLPMLFDYHLKFNYEFINSLFDSKLKEQLGNDVFLSGKDKNQPIVENGVLKDFDEDSVSIDDKEIEETKIIKIEDAKKRVLYYNNVVNL